MLRYCVSCTHHSHYARQRDSDCRRWDRKQLVVQSVSPPLPLLLKLPILSFLSHQHISPTPASLPTYNPFFPPKTPAVNNKGWDPYRLSFDRPVFVPFLSCPVAPAQVREEEEEEDRVSFPLALIGVDSKMKNQNEITSARHNHSRILIKKYTFCIFLLYPFGSFWTCSADTGMSTTLPGSDW